MVDDIVPAVDLLYPHPQILSFDRIIINHQPKAVELVKSVDQEYSCVAYTCPGGLGRERFTARIDGGNLNIKRLTICEPFQCGARVGYLHWCLPSQAIMACIHPVGRGRITSQSDLVGGRRMPCHTECTATQVLDAQVCGRFGCQGKIDAIALFEVMHDALVYSARRKLLKERFLQCCGVIIVVMEGNLEEYAGDARCRITLVP